MGRKGRRASNTPPMPTEASRDFVDVVNRIAVGGEGTNRSFRVLDRTPAAYEGITEFEADLPWYHSSSHLRKEISARSEGGHSISLGTMERLPALLADPVAVFMPEDGRSGRYHIVLDETNTRGKPLVAVASVSGSTEVDGREQRCIFLVTITERVNLDRMAIAVCRSHKVALMHAGRLNALLEHCGMRPVELAWNYERTAAEPARTQAPSRVSDVTCLDATGAAIVPGSLVTLPGGRIVRAEFVSENGFVYDDALLLPELGGDGAGGTRRPRVETHPSDCRVTQGPWARLARELGAEAGAFSDRPEALVALVMDRCRDLVARSLLAAREPSAAAACI